LASRLSVGIAARPTEIHTLSLHDALPIFRHDREGGFSMAVHHLRESDQKSYSYVYSPYLEPVLRVDVGDTIIVETEDAFESRLKTPDHKPSQHLHFPYLNPQSGPIYINGVEKGDTLLVHIEHIEPLYPGEN